eukprot:608910-Amphidinium_carterae.1
MGAGVGFSRSKKHALVCAQVANLYLLYLHIENGKEKQHNRASWFGTTLLSKVKHPTMTVTIGTSSQELTFRDFILMKCTSQAGKLCQAYCAGDRPHCLQPLDTGVAHGCFFTLAAQELAGAEGLSTPQPTHAGQHLISS